MTYNPIFRKDPWRDAPAGSFGYPLLEDRRFENRRVGSSNSSIECDHMGSYGCGANCTLSFDCGIKHKKTSLLDDLIKKSEIKRFLDE